MSDNSDSRLCEPALKSVLAKLLGTFFLALVALTGAAPPTPFAVGLTLLVFVYAVGSLSSSHINLAMGLGTLPAVWATLLSAIIFSLLFSVIAGTAPAEVHDDDEPAAKPIAKKQGQPSA